MSSCVASTYIFALRLHSFAAAPLAVAAAAAEGELHGGHLVILVIPPPLAVSGNRIGDSYSAACRYEYEPSSVSLSRGRNVVLWIILARNIILESLFLYFLDS